VRSRVLSSKTRLSARLATKWREALVFQYLQDSRCSELRCAATCPYVMSADQTGGAWLFELINHYMRAALLLFVHVC